jgi:hypothetical protein
VRLGLTVATGDRVAAAVTVRGRTVSLVIRNLSRGTSATKHLRMSSPDRSSAEWIVEAPSACDRYRGCQTLPLANFGSVAFSGAAATAKGHTGTISDLAWTATAVELGSRDPLASYFGSRRWRWRGELPDSPPSGAVPAALAAGGGSFSVAWQGAAAGAPAPPVAPGPYAP